ncbi:PD-(D/E)XK nuclease family protein [Bradyrhizobium sp. SRS-191]|uniref:PD-(D/E)XK nuclease family protein n=1 Tax=Bradyrhizobium sp. SRS-191 TaxID=2962606 RepID=UPI00211EAC8D|nr:PD-(D/E)XK nuclease family protein [Bradyrhizobium sp. SRS-191]
MDAKTHRSTAIVEGPLAFQMRRVLAARAGENGLQILTWPQLAAHLVGGFVQPVQVEHLEPAIQAAIAAKGFKELDPVAELPGMTRAVARSLQKAWNADIDLAAAAKRNAVPRLLDLAVIEERVRAQLSPATLLPRDLRSAALARVERAPVLVGPVRIERVPWIAPVWRPLVKALGKVVPVEWETPASAETSWFGEVKPVPLHGTPDKADIVSCADPHHEAVEALRWVRKLLSMKLAKPFEIAVAAAAPGSWDEHILALAADTGLRIHFTHGIPALSVRDGQRCAAVADVLVRGLSEQRVRRLIALCSGEGTQLDRLPPGWLAALPRGASLFGLEDWERALRGLQVNGNPIEVGSLLPILGALAKGPLAALEAETLLLRGRSKTIWQTALRAAPAHAIELTLQNIRLADDNDPGDSVVWGPAAHLAAWPRPYVRLLGLTSGRWPRGETDDAILPDHIVAAKELDPDPMPQADRRCFAIVVGSASGALSMSRSRRNAQGNRLGASPLIAEGPKERALARARVPEHAFSEADRLMARRDEAATLDGIKSASQCWRNWHVTGLTDHDGRFRANHPAIARALGRTQSPTSLQLLLRAPLGFVWKYGLGWWAPTEPEQPLTIAPEALGKLVHELLRRAVDALEPAPGLVAASAEQIEAAIKGTAEIVRDTWPLQQPVPPRLLWTNTVRHAAEIAAAALRFGETREADTQSWTEVPFGGLIPLGVERPLPWDPALPVEIPSTGVRIQGTIDRLDLRRVKQAVRVTDYKTGSSPPKAELIVIRGGAELQRSLYALACRQLLPDCNHVVARLLYLAGEPREVRLQDLDGALKLISEFVALASEFLTRGAALPGQDADAAENDLRLAMPASPSYLRRKRSALAKASGRLAKFWDAR